MDKAARKPVSAGLALLIALSPLQPLYAGPEARITRSAPKKTFSGAVSRGKAFLYAPLASLHRRLGFSPRRTAASRTGRESGPEKQDAARLSHEETAETLQYAEDAPAQELDPDLISDEEGDVSARAPVPEEGGGGDPRDSGSTERGLRTLLSKKPSFNFLYDGSLTPSSLGRLAVRAPRDAAHGAMRGLASSRLGRFLPQNTAQRWGRRPPPPRAGTPFDPDEHGGPQRLRLSLAGRLAYGLKSAILMTGMVSAAGYALTGLQLAMIFMPWDLIGSASAPVLSWLSEPSWIAWQLHVPSSWLPALGRVELLTSMGPEALAEALSKEPLAFLAMDLPLRLFMEELSYRGVSFLLPLGLLIGLRKALPTISGFLDGLPDLFRLPSAARWTLNKLVSHPFLLAAVYSGLSFVLGHSPEWELGLNAKLTFFATGFFLSHIAYKTRSGLVPLAAHYAYSLLSMTSLLLTVHFGMPDAAMVYTHLVGVTSAGYLYYAYRGYRKAKQAAIADAAEEAKTP